MHFKEKLFSLFSDDVSLVIIIYHKTLNKYYFLYKNNYNIYS